MKNMKTGRKSEGQRYREREREIGKKRRDKGKETGDKKDYYSTHYKSSTRG